MKSNVKSTLTKQEIAKVKIDDYLAEARAAIKRAQAVSDESGVQFYFEVGDVGSDYIPKPVEAPLTQEKALAILKASDRLSAEMRDKIGKVLTGDRTVTYNEATYNDPYSRARDYGWVSSYG